AVAWHPEQLFFAVAGEDGLVTVNSMKRTLCTFRGRKRFTSLAWQPRCDLLAVGCADSTILLLRMTHELTVAGELRGHSDSINAIAWSPTGDHLLTTSEDHTARVWDPWTGDQLTVLIGHTGPVNAALWSSEVEVVTGSTDHTVRHWNVSDGFVRPMSGMAANHDVAVLIAEARRRLR
ncbi:WD40 repeat domain-containing protein, partial [Lentzea sp.]|uniref:WD40 repeat domain-containing protein n=1 Tax=Lentzea sp. TaxID=56099 RepID=UPI002C016D24|nr:hypothetical protein [Lentzea sp.]